jgi:hypothetical protein
MWLADEAPRNSESRAMAYAVRYIRRVCPRVRGIMTFADERRGPWGVVYQAANFLFVGSHKTRFYELDGEPHHDMLLRPQPRMHPARLGTESQPPPGDPAPFPPFRCVLPLQPAARRGLLLKPRPYLRLAGAIRSYAS